MYFRYDISYSSEYGIDDDRLVYVQAESEEQARGILNYHYSIGEDDGYCGSWNLNSVEPVESIPENLREGYDFLTAETPYSM